MRPRRQGLSWEKRNPESGIVASLSQEPTVPALSPAPSFWLGQQPLWGWRGAGTFYCTK